jgi:hypothetical protein
MNKVLSLINIRDLVTSVFASLIILSLIACGGAAGVLPGLPGMPGALSKLIHIHSKSGVSARIYPTGSGKVQVAAMFQAGAPAASSIAQSYDFTCTVFQAVTPSPFIPIDNSSNDGICHGGGSAAFLTPTAKKTFFDGTLTSLIVTGKTVSGAGFECRDITNTLAIQDNSLSQPFIDTINHKIIVFNQSVTGAPTAAPFACPNIGSDTDQVNTIEVQFAKI